MQAQRATWVFNTRGNASECGCAVGVESSISYKGALAQYKQRAPSAGAPRDRFQRFQLVQTKLKSQKTPEDHAALALEVRLDGAPAARCALCVGLRARAATRNRRPTSRLLFAQSAVVGASQLMAVNRARLSSRQTSASRALSPAEVDARAARDIIPRADTTPTANARLSTRR